MLRQLLSSPKLAPVLIRTGVDRNSGKLCKVIIETGGLRTDRVLAFIEANQGVVEKEIPLIPGVAVTLPQCVLAGLIKFPQVSKVWENSQVRILGEEAAPVYGGALPQEYQYKGKGVTIGVLDTGIDPHEDLTSPGWRILAWNDLVGGKTVPYDDHGHGTRVAGLIAGNGRASHGRYQGVAPQARLAGVKVLDNFGAGWLADLVLGIQWCLANLKTLNIRIINLSLGTRSQGLGDREPLIRATTLAWKQGIVVCGAAGKAGVEYWLTNSPGINKKIITVGKSDIDKTLTNDDERLQQWSQLREVKPANFTVPDLVAPGNNLVSLEPGGGYAAINGPSAATALVSGAVALILEKWPFLNPDQIKALLIKTAGDMGLGTHLQGAGVLDLDKILGKPQKSAQARNPSGGLLTTLLKTALNLFDKINSGSPLNFNDLLMVALPLLNQFLKHRELQ